MLTEEQKKSGQNPAFACVYGTYENGYLQEGMSKRFYAACAAMQGLVAHYGLAYSEQHAKESYKLADELLKQENAE
jgi:hypothetical protein